MVVPELPPELQVELVELGDPFQNTADLGVQVFCGIKTGLLCQSSTPDMSTLLMRPNTWGLILDDEKGPHWEVVCITDNDPISR